MGRKALDVINEICDVLGWEQLPTLEREETLPKDDRKMVRAFNRVLRVLSGMNDWKFLREEGEIVTIQEYTLGLVRVTNGSAQITGLDDPSTPTVDETPVWTVAMEGRALVVANEPLIYRIDRVDSPTSLTLDRPYRGTTSDGSDDAPDKVYKIIQDRYELPPEFDRPSQENWTLYDSNSSYIVSVVDPDMIRRRRLGRSPSNTVQQPDMVTIWDRDEEEEHRVAIFDPFPSEERVVRFEYQTLHPKIDKDSQRIFLTPRFEEMLLSGVEFLMLRGPEDDSRAEMMLVQYLQDQNSDLSKQEIGNQPMRITPSQDRALHQRLKWRRRGRRIDWGSSFDRKDFYDLKGF